MEEVLEEPISTPLFCLRGGSLLGTLVRQPDADVVGQRAEGDGVQFGEVVAAELRRR